MSEIRKTTVQSVNFSSKSNTEISINSIIVWLFYLKENISFDQYTDRRIRNLYGLEADFLNPNIRPGELFTILKRIAKKNQHFVIKICFHWKCITEEILKMLNRNIFNIVEIYVLAETFEQVNKVEAQFGSKITTPINLFYIKDIKALINVAESEVQQFTKPYRTNYNSVCLTGEQKTNEIIKRYRFRLISLINLKRSDQESAQEDFKSFAQLRFTEMKRIQQNLTGVVFNSLMKKSLFDDLLKKYKLTVQKHRQSRKKIEQMQQSNRQVKEMRMKEVNEEFWQTMIEIYQQQGFFYQILNRNLRIIQQDSIEKKWTALAEPFSFMYQSIKNLHLRARETDKQFYQKTADNYVYRGGRIRQSQIMNILAAAIKINKKSQKDQFQTIKDIFLGKTTLQQSQSKPLYLEFYGFLSTSTNLDIVINKFVKQKSQKDQTYDSTTDYGCIFKINIKNNENIYRKELRHLLHGFYKIQKNQSQEQVLFNALNVFKFKAINRKMIVEKKLLDFDQENGEPQDLIHQIQLQYGPFFDFILDKNNEKLNQNEILVKKSYCFCYNKIKRTDQFDIGDAHQTLNQLSQSQRYFESKVIQSKVHQKQQQANKFQISKLDNKNYFLRLSQIYDNRGKTSKAIQYARLSIECYKHMENAQQNMLFIKHMQKLFEMQKRIIDFLQRVSDSLQMQIETQKQMNEIKSLEKGKNHPAYLMRTSELNLKKGVLSFQKGDIDESKDRFENCQKSIKNALQKVSSLKNNNFKKQFFKNLICCSDYQLSCIWSYQKFEQQVKKSLGLDQIQSKKQELQKMMGKAVNLSHYAGQAIEDRVKAFRNKQQYRSIIERFKQAASNLSTTTSQISQEPDLFEKSDNQLLNLIQQEIIKIKKYGRQSQEYKKKFQGIKGFIKEYSVRKKLTIYDGVQEEVQDDFIQKFLKKERENRLTWLEINKNKTINQTIINFQTQFNSIIAEIQHTIEELKEDAVSEYNSKILIQRNQLAQVAWNSSNYELALKQIKLIVQHGDVNGQQKQLQLAKAYKIKGKISLKSQNYLEAIEEAQKSLDYHMALIEKVEKKERQKKKKLAKTATNEQLLIHPEGQCSRHQFNQQDLKLQEISKDKFAEFTNIWANNEFIQSTLLRCKAELYFIYEAKKNIFSQKNPRQKQALERNVASHNILVSSLILQLSKVIQKRKEKLELSELQIQFPEIEGLYKLVKNQHQKQRKEAFVKFNQCITLRNTLYTVGNSGNFIMCAEIIYNFASKRQIYKLIEQNGYFKKIEQFYSNMKEKSNVKWKVQKALYLKQKYNPQRQQRSQISEKKYLEDTISTLMSLNDSCLAKQVHSLQKQMKEYDPSYIFWTQKTEQQEIVIKDHKRRETQILQKSQIRVNSHIIGRLPSLRFQTRNHFSELDKPIKEEEQRQIVEQNIRKIQYGIDTTNSAVQSKINQKKK